MENVELEKAPLVNKVMSDFLCKRFAVNTNLVIRRMKKINSKTDSRSNTAHKFLFVL